MSNFMHFLINYKFGNPPTRDPGYTPTIYSSNVPDETDQEIRSRIRNGTGAYCNSGHYHLIKGYQATLDPVWLMM